jgi:hypothetical protein
MKKTVLLLPLLLSTLNFQLSTAFAQGSLTPPGAPAPTMKSLAQIEPRTAITNSGAVTISQPGSYYLTANITVNFGDAITIATNDVTLDLNGFTISSTTPGAGGAGILLAGGNADISILNGHIKGGVTNNAGTYNGSGFYIGINYVGAQPFNIRVSGLSVSGVLFYGINIGTGNSTLVESCVIKTAGTSGILADRVLHCSAYDCGSVGIISIAATDCSAVGAGTGIQTTVANNCYGQSTGSSEGIIAATANNCYGSSAGVGTGVSCSQIAIGCYGLNPGGGSGVSAVVINSCSGSSVSGTGLSGYIGISSYGHSTSGTAETFSFKYNMP